ncbi:MAG: phosphatase PAP2 family protein [Bacteroidales bacterium]|nr:phosphatase PAP2 family protein [Bacteroidales bacterium]
MRTFFVISIFILHTFHVNAQEKVDTILNQQYDTVNKSDTLIITKQPQNIAPTCSFAKAYAISYWTDTKSVFTNPFRWKTGQIITAAAVVVGTIGLVTWGDKPIQQFFYRNQSPFLNNSSYYFFSPLGNGLISVPALGVFYACGVIWKNKKAKETGLKGLEAYVITAVLTQVIKQVTHRHRPYQDDPPDPLAWDGPLSWGGDYGTFGYNSFPSGHSSAVFAIATVIGLEYWDTKWVPIVTFGLAGFTALYRLAVNDHWASDVLFGSAMGFAVGSMVYFNTNKKLQIVPVSSTGIGVTLIYRL